VKVKEIAFDKQKTGKYRFDIIDLKSILNKKPDDHSQFEHHKLSFFVIIIMTYGEGKHSINYQDYDFKEGTVFTLRKSIIHKFYKTNAQGKFLVFTNDFVIRHSDEIETKKIFRLFNEMLCSPNLQLNNSEFIEIENLLSLIEKEYFQEKDIHSIEIIRNLIQVIIHKLFRIKTKRGRNFDDKYSTSFNSLQELVERDCFESKKVSYYAKKMGVTSRTLNNITQSVIGKSAKSFIDEVLILQIKRLIFNSNLSFTEIAYQSGFDDATNFFKFFRKKTGYSPKEFKENFK